MTHPVLRTQRLLLRPLVAEDAGALTPLIADFEVSRWLTVVPHPYTMADANWFIGSAHNTPGRTWAIEHDSRFIGVISVDNELGYWLGRPFWRQGFMTEAAKAVTAAWFDNPDAAALGSGYFLGNDGSCAILTGLGFRPTHVKKVPAKSLARTVDLQKMSLTRSDWEGRNA